jgi:hypothetical protein
MIQDKPHLFSFKTFQIGDILILHSNGYVFFTDAPKRQTHDRSLSWPVTGTSIKSGGVKLVVWVYTETSNINLISVKTYTLQYSIGMSFRSSI